MSEHVINDQTDVGHPDLMPGLCGCLPRREAYGSLPFAQAQDIDLIPWEEIPDRISDQEKNQSSLWHLWRDSKMGVLNQNPLSYCFPAGTLIRMEDGSNKPIEDVRTTDRVLTAEGNIGRVRATSVRDVNEPIYKMLLWGHGHLRATSEHPVLTKRGYVPISKLKIGDQVAMPKYRPSSVTMIETGEFLYKKNHGPQSVRKYQIADMKRNRGSVMVTGAPGKTKVRMRRHPVPDFIHLTAEFGRVAGFYLAEGHTSSAAVYFSFNVSEKDTFAAECAEKIERALGCETHTRIRQNVCQVTIFGTLWAKLFDAMFACGSSGKRLCKEMTCGPKEFLDNCLSGWMDGDRQRGMSAVSVSRQLALNMFDIANADGKMPILTTHQSAGTGRDGIKRKHAWKVGWGEQRVNHCTEQDEKHLWRTVRGLEQEEFCGSVFNFSVEGDNSYVAEGIGVHNCWCFSGVGGLMLEREIEGLPHLSLSPSSVGGPVTGYVNKGYYIEECLKYMVDHGAATTDYVPQTTTNRASFKQGWNESASCNKVTMWNDVGTNAQKQMTMLLTGRPLPVAHNWWGHAILHLRVLDRYPKLAANNPLRYGRLYLNSWGEDWGDGGCGILEGQRSIADAAYAIEQASFVG